MVLHQTYKQCQYQKKNISDIPLNEISLCVLEQFQNSTLEERVELLEGQVFVIQDEVSDIETDVDFLFAETVIQDERLFTLEQTSIETTADVESNLNFIFYVS